MQLDHLQDEFTKIVGRPSMVPDWALGWHAAKFGLNTKDALDSVFSEHVEQLFGLDGLWSDIDYMD
jgi:alpha-glucosidase (family GH31 glycosyl hydrolase)